MPFIERSRVGSVFATKAKTVLPNTVLFEPARLVVRASVSVKKLFGVVD